VGERSVLVESPATPGKACLHDTCGKEIRESVLWAHVGKWALGQMLERTMNSTRFPPMDFAGAELGG
jgi:hypothetical protein